MTTAAEQVAGNGYLLEEILIRLPAKSATRFKLVSKQWLSHISSPQFVQHHSRHRPNKLPTGMFISGSKGLARHPDFVSFNALNPTYQAIPSLGFLYDDISHFVGDKVSVIIIIKSCNGLLLCIVCFGPWSFDVSAKYCVCNPTTKQFRLLPRGPFSFEVDSHVYLAFDPSVSLHYKVIWTRRNDLDSGDGNFYIYSSEGQCWKTHASPCNPRGEGFFLNGSIYWLYGERSLCFDVYFEKLKPITGPPNTDGVWKRLALFGSHLYGIDWKDRATLDFCLLELSSDFSKCVTKYNFSLSPVLSVFPEIAVSSQAPEHEQVFYRFNAICVVEGVKEDESELVLGIPGKVILYSLKEKTSKELYDLHGELSGPDGYGRVRVHQFIESLSVV